MHQVYEVMHIWQQCTEQGIGINFCILIFGKAFKFRQDGKITNLNVPKALSLSGASTGIFSLTGNNPSISPYSPLSVPNEKNGENGQGKHDHEHANIVFILEGGCIEKRQHHSYERRATDLAFLHAGEAHETTFAVTPTRYLSLDIKPKAFVENNINESEILNTIKKSPDAKFVILKMYRELLYNDHLVVDSLKMLFLEFASLSRVMGNMKKPPAWVGTVHELLNDKWNETTTLKELSLASGVNPITISKHFPAYFACTLGSYLRKLKVERSLSMIKNGGTSLTQTAYSCNFSDQSHFIRNFRAYTSLSPKQYQKL